MADIFTILGVLAIAYTGKKLSERTESYETEEPVDRHEFAPVPKNDYVQKKSEQGNIFNDIAPNRYPGGLPYYLSEASNPYVSGIMNNLSPIEKTMVGPGLGLGPDVPAYGGYQQVFRVKPNNVGAYKKTTLPGRSGCPGNISGGMPGMVGQITHYPAKNHVYVQPVGGRAQQVSGQTGVPSFEYTKRTTNRQETTVRTDGLNFGGAKRMVSALTLEQDPTRNKVDSNYDQFLHVDNPAPGISNFEPGYTSSPAARLMAAQSGVYSTEQLAEFGIRDDPTRGKVNRAGNAGRMNVRADALNQGGLLTAVRMDQSAADGRLGPVNGGSTQQYVPSKFQDLNSYKGMENPRATSDFLNTAKQQMLQNPLAQIM
jgi:hypothetical protein